MPKALTPTGSRHGRRHNPLEDDLTATGPLRSKPSKRKSRAEDDEEEKFVDSKSSRKILKIGQELADEDDEEGAVSKPNTAFDFGSRFEEEDEPEGDFDGEEAWGDEDEIVEEVELAPEDLATFSKFFPSNEDPLLQRGWPGVADEEEEEQQGTDLTALMLARIAEFEAGQGRNGAANGAMQEDDYELPAKVVEVYTKIGFLLSRYKSGKLPKPFKILPTVPHWEDILQVTRPDKWSPNACKEATKIFISSTPIVARRFIEMVLLDKVREDIHETKKLNVHLFDSLKKSLYKPAAFFKGFLFPLVDSGTCTLREAHIISSVLVKVSIPLVHSAVAIKTLCDIAAQETTADTEGGGATNIFIKALLEKKYALPYQTIDALVFHFLRFRAPPQTDAQMGGVQGSAAGFKDSKLPVIWHQCLLAFAQRYKNAITEDQREALLDMLLTKGHSQIGPEVRRELLEGRGRGVALEPEAPAFGGDDTMMVDDM